VLEETKDGKEKGWRDRKWKIRELEGERVEIGGEDRELEETQERKGEGGANGGGMSREGKEKKERRKGRGGGKEKEIGKKSGGNGRGMCVVSPAGACPCYVLGIASASRRLHQATSACVQL